ncbi:hypothetical protein C8R44DRAFT_751969 [Mycena epipterygia]|nr:hypothetical protein C8R44DRAFT_751969 [Mycena epipterygia]
MNKKIEIAAQLGFETVKPCCRQSLFLSFLRHMKRSGLSTDEAARWQSVVFHECRWVGMMLRSATGQNREQGFLSSKECERVVVAVAADSDLGEATNNIPHSGLAGRAAVRRSASGSSDLRRDPAEVSGYQGYRGPTKAASDWRRAVSYLGAHWQTTSNIFQQHPPAAANNRWWPPVAVSELSSDGYITPIGHAIEIPAFCSLLLDCASHLPEINPIQIPPIHVAGILPESFLFLFG